MLIDKSRLPRRASRNASVANLRRKVPGAGNEGLLARRPMVVGGWEFRERSAVPVGTPTFQQTEVALELATGLNEGSPYWIVDILAHAENRRDWREKFSQLLTVTGLSPQTLHNLMAVTRVELPERLLAPTITHAIEVASLSRSEQTEVLQYARTEGLSSREDRKSTRLNSSHRL